MQLVTFLLSTETWALRKLLYVAGSGDPQPLLHLFQRNSFGFRVHKQDHEKLQAHHQGEKDERISAGRCGQQREYKVGAANGHSLQIRRYFVEPGEGENVI